MGKSVVLVIEPNLQTRKLLAAALSDEFEIILSENGLAGVESARTKLPSLIVLEAALPHMNGFDICALLKKDPRTKMIPIIFLTSLSGIANITKAFELGAEDFMTKPFDFQELLVRMKARLKNQETKSKEPRVLRNGKLQLVIDSKELHVEGKSIDLTTTEFDILKLLLDNAGQTVKREEIISKVWRKSDGRTSKRTIDVHIRSIRKKIPSIAHNITSSYGVGYKFKD